MVFISQDFPKELQVDVTDFRMRHDKTNGPTLLNMLKNHYHKSYEIYYLISGETYYFIKNKTFHIKAGDIVLVNSYDLHRTSLVNNKDKERILICMNESYISALTSSYSYIDLFSCFKKGNPVLSLDEYNSAAIKEHLSKMFTLYTNNRNKFQNLDELCLKAMCVELLVLLNKLSNSIEPHFVEHPSVLHKKISNIVFFIDNNYMNEITLDSIALQFNISKYHFVRLFKEIMGLTFIDYLNVVRLKESRNLLIRTNYAISRIASEVGYSDANYFCRVFKKYSNCTPSEYKKTKTMATRK